MQHTQTALLGLACAPTQHVFMPSQGSDMLLQLLRSIVVACAVSCNAAQLFQLLCATLALQAWGFLGCLDMGSKVGG